MSQKKTFIVYKSSAGSGKTFTIAKTYLTLILSKTNPNYFKRILAITFTVKAASEMKERIIGYLASMAGRENGRKDAIQMLNLLVQETKLTPEEIKLRSEQVLLCLLHNYNDFAILTIDKFIHRLVRSFASDLNLTPDFEVEIDQSRINDLVIAELMAKAGLDSKTTEILLQFVQHQISEDKSWNIDSLILDTVKELNNETFFLNQESFKTLELEDILIAKAWLNDTIQAFEQDVKTLGQRSLSLIDSNGLNSSDFYQGSRGILGFFSAAAKSDLSKLQPNSYALKTIEENKWQSGSKNQYVLSIADELKTIFLDLNELSRQVGKIKFYIKVKRNLFMMGLISELNLLIYQVRSEENLQTLSDFYRILNMNLSEESTSFIYERIGNKFNHILIDEFQDTSILQWQSLQPLLVNSLSEGFESVIVGDSKQAIYRFRGSEPNQFVSLPDSRYESGILLKSLYQEFVLSHNFRSSKSIVAFNNQFFRELTANLTPEILEVYKNLEQKQFSEKSGRVRVNAFEFKESNKLDAAVENIIRRLRAVLKEGVFQHKDFCLLFQRNHDASYVASRLLGEGFQVVSDESLMLIHNPKINLLISTLQAYKHNSDLFHLHTWLIRLHQNLILTKPYYLEALKLRSGKHNFKTLVRQLNLNLDFQELSAGESFSVLAYLCKYFNFSLSDPFVSRLLDLALEFDHSSQYLKVGFLEFWAEIGEKQSIELLDSPNAIRLMTIHKSKGLEFPVVFVYLPEIETKRTTKSQIWLHENLDIPKIRSLLVDTSALKDSQFHSCYQEELDATMLDLLNTYYVALTRASGHLEIFTLAKDDHISNPWFAALENWPEWNKENLHLEFTCPD